MSNTSHNEILKRLEQIREKFKTDVEKWMTRSEDDREKNFVDFVSIYNKYLQGLTFTIQDLEKAVNRKAFLGIGLNKIEIEKQEYGKLLEEVRKEYNIFSGRIEYLMKQREERSR